MQNRWTGAPQFWHIHLTFKCIVSSLVTPEFFDDPIFDGVKRDDGKAPGRTEQSASCRQCVFERTLFVIDRHAQRLEDARGWMFFLSMARSQSFDESRQLAGGLKPPSLALAHDGTRQP